MNHEEEGQYEIQQWIEQEEPPSPRNQTIIGILGIIAIFALPTIIDWVATGHRPWRF